MSSGYLKRLTIWETNYGRDAGWILERGGRPIAILSDPRYEDMFWDSYKLEIVAEDPELRARIATKEFWDEPLTEGLVYRNRLLGDTANHPFAAASPFPEPGRILMRGLYLRIGAPKPWGSRRSMASKNVAVPPPSRFVRAIKDPSRGSAWRLRGVRQGGLGSVQRVSKERKRGRTGAHSRRWAG